MEDDVIRLCDNCVYHCIYVKDLDDNPRPYGEGICHNQFSPFFQMKCADIRICGQWREKKK